MEMQMRVGATRGFGGKAKPETLQAWFANALAAAPDQRFASAAEMRQALERALAPRTPSRRGATGVAARAD